MPTVVDRRALTAGEWILDKYQVIKTLGEGTFGLVCLIKDKQGNKYALKLLRLWDVPSEIRKPLVERFKMEFKTGQIKCEYLVHSIDYGYVGGNPYIVMEFCPGGDLTTYFGSRDEAKKQAACRQILYGLKALHSNGKVHRDLKPENVLFKENGIAALTDFGISGDRNKRMTERNIFGKPNQIFGTYAYMPPEQVNRARGQATVLPTTDIFSFGVLTYQLLTGSLPFGPLESHNDLANYLKKVKEGTWHRSPLQNIPNASAWCRLIEGCLIPDFKNRFQTVDEVLRHIPGQATIPYVPQPLMQNEATFGCTGAILNIMQGDEYGKVYMLDQLTEAKRKMLLRVGRSSDNDIHILEHDSTYVSRYHCTLEKDSNQRWIIRDGQWNAPKGEWIQSSNGTFVGSSQVTKLGMTLCNGDIVSIGDTKLRFELN